MMSSWAFPHCLTSIKDHKLMSKFILRKRTQGFIIVSASIINALKNNLGVLGFYNYLLSLPDNWVFYKTKLCKECSIGINKLDNYLKMLKSLGLVGFGQKRNAQGRFEHFYLDVYDKEQINNENNDLENAHPPVYENHRTVKTVARSQEAIQYTNTQYTKNLKNYCASDDARDLPSHSVSEEIPLVEDPIISIPKPIGDSMKHRYSIKFEEFWKVYPRDENKKRASEIWERKKLEAIADVLIEDVNNRKALCTQWQDPKFVPHGSTYLNGERWQDEILADDKTNRTSDPTRQERIVSPVPTRSTAAPDLTQEEVKKVKEARLKAIASGTTWRDRVKEHQTNSQCST